MMKNLVDRYSLKLNKIEFEVDIFGNETKKGISSAINNYVDFVIYSTILEQKGIDINNLVRQIKPCTTLNVIRHASHLSILSYIYQKNDNEIEFLPPKDKEPDFLINGIKTDLKVAQLRILKKPRKNLKTKKKKAFDIGNEILLEIIARIKSRFLKGCRQADLLYFNLTESIFSALGIPVAELYRIIQPQQYRLILYSTRFIHHNAEPFHKYGDNEKFLGKITFPDLYLFKGYFIDFDPYLWTFFSQTDIFQKGFMK